MATRVKQGVSVPCRCPPACRVLRARAAWYCPPSPSPSGLGCLSPLWPCGRPLLPESPRRLDRLLAPPAPVSLTRSRAQAWRRWRRQRRWDACAGSPRCLRLTPYPAVGLAAVPSPDRASSPRLRWWLRAPRLLGWWGGFRPLPTLVLRPLLLLLPRWATWRFRPPRATLPLRGCQHPVAA